MIEPVYVVYDGECPFCTAYVKMLRLRAALGPVELVDARGAHPMAADLRERGLDLDEGMAVIVHGTVHHGADAIHWLSMMTTPSASFNGMIAWLLRDGARARVCYPVLRAGRNAALFLLGRKRLTSPVD